MSQDHYLGVDDCLESSKYIKKTKGVLLAPLFLPYDESLAHPVHSQEATHHDRPPL